MARGPIDFIGGLLEGLASLPQQLFGGKGLGGLLDGIFGRRGRPTPGSQAFTPKQQFSSFPAPAPKVVKNTPRPAPSTVKRAKRHMDWDVPKRNPLSPDCSGGS